MEKKSRVSVKDDTGKIVYRYITKELKESFDARFKGIPKMSTFYKWYKKAKVTAEKTLPTHTETTTELHDSMVLNCSTTHNNRKVRYVIPVETPNSEESKQALVDIMNDYKSDVIWDDTLGIVMGGQPHPQYSEEYWYPKMDEVIVGGPGSNIHDGVLGEPDRYPEHDIHVPDVDNKDDIVDSMRDYKEILVSTKTELPPYQKHNWFDLPYYFVDDEYNKVIGELDSINDIILFMYKISLTNPESIKSRFGDKTTDEIKRNLKNASKYILASREMWSSTDEHRTIKYIIPIIPLDKTNKWSRFWSWASALAVAICIAVVIGYVTYIYHF